MVKAAYNELMKYIQANPDHVVAMNNAALDKQFMPKVDKPVGEDPNWSAGYQKLEKLADYYLRGLMMIWQPKFTEQKLEAMQKKNRLILWELMQLCVGLNRFWAWHSSMKPKQFLGFCFHCFYKDLGQRISGDELQLFH